MPEDPIHLGGILRARLSDGSVIDSVYGVDANGDYLGLVPAAQAVQQANRAPPRLGRWRLAAGQWVAYKTLQMQAMDIDRQRDERIAAGVIWSARTWYADPVFQQRLQGVLQAFAEGLLQAGDTVPIRAMDKTVYQLTRLEVRQLLMAVLNFVQAQYAWSWAQKAQIGA